MFSNSVHCRRTHESISAIDSSQCHSWLSNAVDVESFSFPVAVPHLTQLIGHAHIRYCIATRQFCFKPFPGSNSSTTTSWSIAHSASQRCKLIETQLNLRPSGTFVNELVEELHSLASHSLSGVDHESIDFSSLLQPLLIPSEPGGDAEEESDDVLLLFGRPASLFQILLATPSLTSRLAQFILECVAESSPHAFQLIDQYNSPIGLFIKLESFVDLASELIEIVQLLSSNPSLQCYILDALPDLAVKINPNTVNDSAEDTASTDRRLLLKKLLDLLSTASLITSPQDDDQAQVPRPTTAYLVDCAAQFLDPSGQEDLYERFVDTCFQLLDRCYDESTYFSHLPTVTNRLLVNSVLNRRANASTIIARLRQRLAFPKQLSPVDVRAISNQLIDTLSLAFRLSPPLLQEWINVTNQSLSSINFEPSTDPTNCKMPTGYQQRIQDFIMLCIIHHLSGPITNLPVKTISKSPATMSGRQKSAYSCMRNLISTCSSLDDESSTFCSTLLTDYAYLLLDELTDVSLWPTLRALIGHFLSPPPTSPLRPFSLANHATRRFGLVACLQALTRPGSEPESLLNLLLRPLLDGCSASTTFQGQLGAESALTGLLHLSHSQPHLIPDSLTSTEDSLTGSNSGVGLLVEAIMPNCAVGGTSDASSSRGPCRVHWIRRISLLLGRVCFSDRQFKGLQENLLALVRQLLTSRCLLLRATGIIAAAAIIATICQCRSDQSSRTTTEASQSSSEFIILASQVGYAEAESRRRSSISNTTTSTSRSSLSLRGPGTSLADRSSQLLINVDTDSESLAPSVNTSAASCSIQPPDRLLVQLTGLVERSCLGQPQLYSLWLDEVALLAHSHASTAFSKDNNEQSSSGWRFLQWMGSRVMRDFQDHFVCDRDSNCEQKAHFGLNDTSVCDIAIGIGSLWTRFAMSNGQPTKSGTSWLSQLTSSKQRSPETSSIPPSLAPCFLRLLGVIEALNKSDGIESIDALLGCPVQFPATDLVIANLDNNSLTTPLSQPLIHQLLICTNWFIETVNVFSPFLLARRRQSTASPPQQSTTLDNPSTLANLYLTSILTRLGQIAGLRCLLFHQLRLLADCDPPSRSDLCLPTASFDPNQLTAPQSSCHSSRVLLTGSSSVTTQLAPSTATTASSSSSCQCLFACCLHPLTLTMTAKTKTVGRPAGDKSTNGKRPSSKAKASKIGQKKARLDEDETRGEDEASRLNDSPSLMTDDNSDDPTPLDATNSLVMTMVGSSKFGVGKTNTDAGLVKSFTTNPSLISVSTCFREVELSTVVLGLSSWPWSRGTNNPVPVDLSNTVAPDLSTDADKHHNHDWLTLNWLMDELVQLLRCLTTRGDCSQASFHHHHSWYSFQRLLSLRPRILDSLLEHLAGQLKRLISLIFTLLLSLTSDSSQSSSLPPLDSLPNESTTSQLNERQLINRILCSAFHSLSTIISLASSTPCRSSSKSSRPLIKDRLLCSQQQSIQQRSSHSKLLRILHQLSADCGTSSMTTSAASRIHVEALLTDNSSSWYIDHLDPNILDSLDRCGDGQVDQIGNNTNSNQSDVVRSCLSWLTDLLKSRQPHHQDLLGHEAVDLHCQLMAQLIGIARDLAPSSCASSTLSDLFLVTKNLLSRKWPGDDVRGGPITWQGIALRDTFGYLLSIHLRCTPPASPSQSSPSDSDQFNASLSPTPIVALVRGVLLDAIKRLTSCDSGGDPPNGETVNDDGYVIDNLSTVELYCTEVIDAVLWYSRQLCLVQKHLSSTPPCQCKDRLPGEGLLLAHWNDCLTCLVLLASTLFDVSAGSGKKSRTVKQPKLIRRLLPVIMRGGRLMISSLLKGAMPLVAAMFRYQSTEATTFLRNTQQLTRFLQRLCTHGKIHQDSALTNQIPLTRRCLETFVYRVKTTLSQHQCADAFWLGTLKNRNLHGSVLRESSPSSTSEAKDSGDDEEVGTGSRTRRRRMISRPRSTSYGGGGLEANVPLDDEHQSEACSDDDEEDAGGGCQYESSSRLSSSYTIHGTTTPGLPATTTRPSFNENRVDSPDEDAYDEMIEGSECSP